MTVYLLRVQLVIVDFTIIQPFCWFLRKNHYWFSNVHIVKTIIITPSAKFRNQLVNRNFGWTNQIKINLLPDERIGFDLSVMHQTRSDDRNL